MYKIIVVALTLCVANLVSAKSEQGFKPLFNGENFDGLYLKIRSGDAEMAKKVFAIEDKAIHVFNDEFPQEYKLDSGDNDTHGLFYTMKKYSKYILRFEYKWGTNIANNFKQWQYDAGVYYHVTQDDVWPVGIEYQLRYNHLTKRNHSGDLIRPKGSDYWWFPDGNNILKNKKSKGLGHGESFLHPNKGGKETKVQGWMHFASDTDNFNGLNDKWNQVEIIVMGSQYTIHKLNGDVVNMATNLQPAEGIIGFQAETAEIFYRNIEIKELEKSIPKEEFLKLSSAELAGDYDPNLHQKILPLSPEASLKTMVLQDGYSMEIVAAEPLIEEPVTMTFDANGRLYVAEMLTYMQDADGSDTFKAVSRIKRLEDKDGDGIFESYTVFADNLLLPRMITTLDDGRILVRETNTLDLLLLTDTDDDGVADLRETVYQGGNRGGNLEHQPSGLIYGLDNWMYVTYTDKRYKFVDGKVIAQDIPYGGGQWGLTQDHLGRFYYSTAGGQDPAFTFQAPSVYGQVTVAGQQAQGYREVFPLSTTPDVQGGLKMLRPDNTLNHFTGGGGQSIYLGGIFDDMQGDYIIAEPVGNLIRRSKVTRKNGYTVLSNRYQSQKKEFIASSDPNFRPVWTETAPDGSLMILDMYRGIIQEGNWTQKGSYLRGVIDKYGFDKVIGRGRLYRVTKPGVALDKLPKMFSKQPQQLIQYLSHKNRWWRLEAQKLMVLSGDKKLALALKKVAQNNNNPLAQIHALWTLEGLGVIDKQILIDLFNSQHSDVRVTAIRISEQLAAAGDKSISEKWLSLASDNDIEVAQQVILSAYYVSSDNHQAVLAAAKKAHPNKKGIAAIEKSMADLIAHNVKRRKLEQGNKALAAAVIAGEKAYKGLCYTCHGENGMGAPAGNTLIAPSLHNNPRVIGNTASLINLVLHGMQGAIDGVTYTGGMMPSISSNGDEYVANVLTYIRNNFDNQASMISAQDVAAVKKMHYAPKAMWTQSELDDKFAKELTNKSQWKVTTNFAVHPNLNIEKLTDTITERPFFSSKGNREKGLAITIELPQLAIISEVVIDSNILKAFYSRHYTIEFSKDGKNWITVINNSSAGEMNREQTLGHQAKFIRVTNQVTANRKPWRIQEISLFGSYL